MFTFSSRCSAPYKVSMTINGTPMDMEIDTGASLSVLSEGVYWDLHNKGKLPHLAKTEVVLRTYTGEEVKPKGSLDVMVIYEEKEYHLPLLVVYTRERPCTAGKKLAREAKA